MKPLGDGFIKLIKMLIAPIVFTTVVAGIARMGDMKKVGRVGLKAILYFEVLTTLALPSGLLVGKLVQPGAGMHVERRDARHRADRELHHRAARPRTDRLPAQHHPQDVVEAFARGDILQVLFFAILFGRGARGARQGRRSCCASSSSWRTCSSHRRDRHAGRAHRRLRRHGVHRRQVRARRPAQPRQADGDLLRHGLLFVLLVLGLVLRWARASASSASCATSARRS